ncbi:GNAT family N-acetyltransferase [Streptomyces sp. NPDC001922]|uniref:GNAT family N-acetyltransferase n=1 Tax=Streptomyces sp. NPDC001922 TaxID=3364624 RepID=UPI00367EEBD3
MFEIGRLGPGDLALILGLQQRIHSSQPDRDTFQLSTPEFIAYCLGEGGRCYGVRHHGETVAYRMVYFPRERAFNLARDTPLPRGELVHAAHWDTIAVLPRWRGHGLSGLMNARALADLADTGIRHLFATSSPRNPHGVRSLIATGFRPVRVALKFGGKLRFLFYRPFPADWPAGHGPVPERAVALSDTAGLEDAFRRGWVGTGIDVTPAAPRLRMQRHPLPFGP